MGKQNRSRKTDSLGKGKVTPVQIAFIVDRYLSDNNLSETRSTFRTEASSLISKSPVREAPKTLLSLGAILNEYICLKEQKVILDQEKVRLEQEKFRVQNLLHGMQQVMNAYSASENVAAAAAATPTPLIQTSVTRSTVMVPPADPFRGSPAAAGCPMYKSPTGFPASTPSNTAMDHSNLSSITNQQLTRKRMGSSVVAESVPNAKKSRGKLASRKIPSKGTHKQSDNASATQANVEPSPVIASSTQNCTPPGPIVQASSVAKSLFKPLPSPPTSSSNSNTPPQVISSHNDKSASPKDISANAHCSNNNTPQQVTPTNCTVITSERVTVSPFKNMTYYTLERNQCISSTSPVKRMCKRDCVKGRLDFDGSDATVNLDKPVDNEFSTSESDKEGDIFDLDLPNLDVFGANFSFSELLVDLDLDCEGIVCPCQPALAASTDTISGSSHESRDGNLGTDQVMSEFSSTMTEVISGKDMHKQGPDITAVKSITKCIRILSPAKGQRSSLDQDNCLASN